MIVNQLKNNDNLTQSEQMIAKYLLDKNNNISDITAIELGKRSYTSQGSVTRLYKKLGCNSYREFISTLIIEREEYYKYNKITNDNPGKFFTSITDIQKVISSLYSQTINRTNLGIDSNTFTRICNRIMSAKSIDIYGVGISDTIAKQMAFKLQALDLPSKYHNGINKLYIKNMKNKNTNISIFITLSGYNTLIQEMVNELKNYGIYTVVLMGKKNNELIALCSDYLLFDTSIFDDVDSMISTFSAEYIVNLIYATLIYKIQVPYTK